MQKYSDDFQLPLKDTCLREGTGISNLDGRLWGEVGAETARFFGDEAMVRARVGIEARYLIGLSKAGIFRKFTDKEKETLLTLHRKITPEVYNDLRKIENEIHHDVMAMIEIFKKLLIDDKLLLKEITPWLHWGLTTYDLDDTAKALMIKNFIHQVYLPQISKTLKSIVKLSLETKEVVMVGKTHLQPAVPTLMGKEIILFGMRLAEIDNKIYNFRLRGKLTGAVGNLAAQKSVYSKINWLKFSQNFIESLGLEANLFTTQIEPKDTLVELLGLVEQLNLILIDLSQDMRIYIGFDWLFQEVKKMEVGSSAMPQKVNPIDFENSEGNALFSNWILEGLRRQLPISWLQRDLVDKTILRNLGVPFGHSLISLLSANKGLSKVSANKEKITEELNSDWSILSEAFQTKLRAVGLENGYEKIKELSRGRKLTRKEVWRWIEKLLVKDSVKEELKEINPRNYIGYARENLREMIAKIEAVIKKTA